MGRTVSGVLLFAAVAAAFRQGIVFMQDYEIPRIGMTLFAILWAVGGIIALFLMLNLFYESVPKSVRGHFAPVVFVGPAVLVLAWFVFLPTLRSFWISLFSDDGFVFLSNYLDAFTDRAFLIALRNTVIWVVLCPLFCVLFGLAIALIAERSGFEIIGKALIFMPMAISYIGAGIIWKFVYSYMPAGESQIGLLNAIITSLGFEPRNWIVLKPLINSVLLAAVFVWMQTGYAMVLLSSAIKGVSDDLLEAARIDGAGEFQIIWSIIIPVIRGTIITVATTITIFSLKIFDIVWSMTGGQFNTDILATLQYKEAFVYYKDHMGATYAIILLLAVVPVVVYNLRQFLGRAGKAA